MSPISPKAPKDPKDPMAGLKYGIYIPSFDDFIIYHIDPVVLVIEDSIIIGAIRYRKGKGVPIPFTDYAISNGVGEDYNYKHVNHFRKIYPFEVMSSHRTELWTFNTEEEAYLMKIQALTVVREHFLSELQKLHTEIDRKIPFEVQEEFNSAIMRSPEYLL
jgi:hypothetical protein